MISIHLFFKREISQINDYQFIMAYLKKKVIYPLF